MEKRLRKTLILGVKLLVAGGLLYYVLGKVHWRDYAVTVDGEEMAVFSTRAEDGRPGEFQVRDADSGRLRWLKGDAFRPVSLRSADGETVIVRDCRPDWKSPKEYFVRLPSGRTRWMGLASLVLADAHVLRRGFLSTVQSARPFLLLAAFACFIAPRFILSLRWWYLLRIQRIRIRLWEAVRLTFLGEFFNFVVPGTVSGDLVKAYYVSKHTDRGAAALISVFVDRVVGLLEFAMLPAVVMVALWLAVGWSDRLFMPAVVVAVVLALVAMSLALLLSPALRQRLRLRKVFSRLPMQRHIDVLSEAANLYRRRRVVLLKAVVITFAGQVLFIAAILLSGLSLALPVPWYDYFLYVPLIYIIAAVPISPGGLGLAETFYVTFLVPAGAAASEVLALAVVVRLMPMIVSLPGLVVALKGPKLPATEQMQAALAARPDK